MGLGILDMVGLVAALAFAIPVALFGLERLVAGDALLGGALLGIAAGMVIVEEYVTTPRDIPAAVASEAASRVVTTDDEED